ncbi:MAG: hypothetical protein NZ937_08575 [Armatimonadetes bacterium]|nr:hypothetical protein [Armatimonadota bacterium]
MMIKFCADENVIGIGFRCELPLTPLTFAFYIQKFCCCTGRRGYCPAENLQCGEAYQKFWCRFHLPIIPNSEL